MTSPAIADKTALIIDDQEFVLNIVTKMMERIGFARVETAADGAEGLERVASMHPDVVLCDIAMRPMDGLTFLEQLRKRVDKATRDTPVIFLTSHGRHELVAKARELGADGFITKPASVTHLQARIEEAIAGRGA